MQGITGAACYARRGPHSQLAVGRAGDEGGLGEKGLAISRKANPFGLASPIVMAASSATGEVSLFHQFR